MVSEQTLQYFPILEYDFSQWFETIESNGHTLSINEIQGLINTIDECVEVFSSGLPLAQNSISEAKDHNDEYSVAYFTIVSAIQFVAIIMTDCLVASKYFLLADQDYDKRFMRGKLMVILNAGFSRLYGFEGKTRKKSEWNRLAPIIDRMPNLIKKQYKELSARLETHATSSSWWREERNLETHLDTEALYVCRSEPLDESKVMISSLKLFNTLMAVNNFLRNAHASFVNDQISKLVNANSFSSDEK